MKSTFSVYIFNKRCKRFPFRFPVSLLPNGQQLTSCLGANYFCSWLGTLPGLCMTEPTPPTLPGCFFWLVIGRSQRAGSNLAEPTISRFLGQSRANVQIGEAKSILEAVEAATHYMLELSGWKIWFRAYRENYKNPGHFCQVCPKVVRTLSVCTGKLFSTVILGLGFYFWRPTLFPPSV